MVIQPKGVQNEVLALDAKGHTVVLGTAGSGKTTMALLRAKKLSNLAGHPEVLVVTFNRALVTYMNGIQSSARGITVEHYHLFARGYLNNVEKMGSSGRKVILEEDDKAKIIAEIVEYAKQKYPQESSFARPVQTFIEEIQFLQKFGVDTLEQYETMERVGRADTNIKRENRKWFYKVYIAYKTRREKLGYLYNWDDIAIAVYNSLTEDKRERRYS